MINTYYILNPLQQRRRYHAFLDLVFLFSPYEFADDYRNSLLSARNKEVVLIWLSTAR